MKLPANSLDPTGQSRRRFLQSSGAALAAGAVSQVGLIPHVHAAGDDRLRIGLVGCGGRGTGAAAQALKADSNVRLVAEERGEPKVVSNGVLGMALFILTEIMLFSGMISAFSIVKASAPLWPPLPHWALPRPRRNG